MVRTAFSLARRVRGARYDLLLSTTNADLKIAGSAARMAGHAGIAARLYSGWSPSTRPVRHGWSWRRHRWYHRSFVLVGATNSRAGREEIIARDYLPPDRVVPIYNGVDLSRFDPERVPRGRFRAELGIPADAEVVVSISRFAERKGQRHELAAALQLAAARPRLHMVFVGPCRDQERPFRDALRAAAAAAPGDVGARMHFLDERSDVPNVLADADVLVRAALAEGLPNCALEAMVMRVPVVATGICGTPEAVLDGVTGWLVPPGDAQAIARAMGEVLDAAPERRREMGEAGRRHVLAHFTLERMADAYEDLFRRAMDAQDARTTGHG